MLKKMFITSLLMICFALTEKTVMADTFEVIQCPESINIIPNWRKPLIDSGWTVLLHVDKQKQLWLEEGANSVENTFNLDFGYHTYDYNWNKITSKYEQKELLKCHYNSYNKNDIQFTPVLFKDISNQRLALVNTFSNSGSFVIKSIEG